MGEYQRKKVSGAVYGSLAYDLDALVRERALEEAGQIEPERRPKPQPVRRPHQQAAVRPHARISPLVLGSAVVLVAMVVMLLMGYVRLTEISTSVSGMKEEISQLNEEHVALLTEYEKTLDMAGIKEKAEAAGMEKPSAGQIEYIELASSDAAVVYDSEGENFLDRGIQSLQYAAASVLEYFE